MVGHALSAASLIVFLFVAACGERPQPEEAIAAIDSVGADTKIAETHAESPRTLDSPAAEGRPETSDVGVDPGKSAAAVDPVAVAVRTFEPTGDPLARLTKLLARLPGIGEKSALRLALARIARTQARLPAPVK